MLILLLIPGKTYNLDTDGDLPSLRILLEHKSGFTVADIPMGEVVIDLLTIDPTNHELELPIAATGRMKTVSGTVHDFLVIWSAHIVFLPLIAVLC